MTPSPSTTTKASGQPPLGSGVGSSDSGGVAYSGTTSGQDPAGSMHQDSDAMLQPQQQHNAPHHPSTPGVPRPNVTTTQQQHQYHSTPVRINLTAKPHAFAGAVLSPKHARELTPSLCLAIASALSEQSHRRAAVPYTLWITEAWRVLGWAEPSAALFWELATMYHTLFLAGRAYAAEYQDGYYASAIPPILSCGSTSSMGSGATTTQGGGGDRWNDKKKWSSSAASAKELPVWLVGTFLLLHCEDFAYQRNLSGQDDRRFYGGAGYSGVGMEPVIKSGGKVDFTSLLKNQGLSPRTRLHANWNNDNSHCTAYLLRHLRKILLLTAVPHSQEAVNACMHLAVLPSPQPLPPSDHRSRARVRVRYDTDELHRQHDEEHGKVGLNVRLTLEDLERLHLVLQPPQGGGIDDPPVRIGEYLWHALRSTAPPPPMVSIPVADIEREIRRHLEAELEMSITEPFDKDDISTDDEDSATAAMAKLSLSDKPVSDSGDSTTDSKSSEDAERAKQPSNQYLKELSYTHLHGTTILLKPNTPETSCGASQASGEVNFSSTLSSSQRLHDLAIQDCSDAHFYLLQPFEHATIASCTGCTIVVGAVAGLLHVVDCEKTMITAASRRILVSNSCDVQMYVFTPSPPLLVGDNRSCQFAPYNTYYDGFREDLLATGLAAAVVPESQSPYHGGRSLDNNSSSNVDAAWPPLQCASNKWKLPVEMSKLEMPQVPANASLPPGSTNAAGSVTASPTSPGADDKAMGKPGTGNDATMHAPVLLAASEFHVLFVPLESDAARQRRQDAANDEANNNNQENVNANLPQEGQPQTNNATANPSMESQYCRILAEVLQLSPFRLPVEYERRVLMKVDRMRNIQQAMQKNLTVEQQRRFEEELNRGFRDWLVTSGNLRQVLDLVHLERRGL